jgi:hypothetical protein
VPLRANATDSANVTVIGVAGDFRNAGLTNRPEPHLTVLYAQHPLVNYGFKDIVLWTTAEPHLVAPAVTRELHRLDPDLPFAEVQTIEELVDQQTGGQRLTATPLAVLAAGGLALAVVGIYGVVSFLVAQRRIELAVRMALGASARAVLKESLGMAVIGSALGLAAATAAQRMTSGLLFDVSPVDLRTFAGATVVLLGSRLLRRWCRACARCASIQRTRSVRTKTRIRHGVYIWTVSPVRSIGSSLRRHPPDCGER